MLYRLAAFMYDQYLGSFAALQCPLFPQLFHAVCIFQSSAIEWKQSNRGHDKGVKCSSGFNSIERLVKNPFIFFAPVVCGSNSFPSVVYTLQ